MLHNYAVVALMYFFSRDVLRISNVKGGGIRKYQKLDPRITAAIICKKKHCMLFDSFLSYYTAFVCKSYDDTKVSVLNQVINNKCTAARRGVSKAAEQP